MRIASIPRIKSTKTGLDISEIDFERPSISYSATLNNLPGIRLEVAFFEPASATPDHIRPVTYSLVYGHYEKMQVFALLKYSPEKETSSGKIQESIDGKVEIGKEELSLAERLTTEHKNIVQDVINRSPLIYDKPERDLCIKLADYVLARLEHIDILNHPELSTF